MLTLYKTNGKTQLKGRGGDLEDIDLILQCDPDGCHWNLAGETETVHLIENDHEIVRVIEECQKVTATEVTKILGKNRNNTSDRIGHLWAAGQLAKEVRGGVPFYSLKNSSNLIIFDFGMIMRIVFYIILISHF